MGFDRWEDCFVPRNDDGVIFKIALADALPVTLQSFNGSLQNGMAQLHWTSGTESNFNRYEVEKSTDNKTYTSTATITAKGSNSNYTFSTPQSEPVAYYRLNLVDNNGVSTYSNILTLSQNGGTGIQVYPNPAHSYINVKVSAAGTLTIYNAAGSVVKTQALTQGVNTVDVSALVTGVYYGSVNGSSYKVKFIKQ